MKGTERSRVPALLRARFETGANSTWIPLRKSIAAPGRSGQALAAKFAPRASPTRKNRMDIDDF
jgi:hypothetical protein